MGFEYTFMRNTSDGNTIARPITEYFFRKVLADKKLGIEKDAKFVKPAELENEMLSADIIISDSDPNPGAEGDDQGVGNPEDYDYNGGDSLGPESQQYEDNIEGNNPKPQKKDTVPKAPANKKDDETAKPIGSLVEDPKKKKNN